MKKTIILSIVFMFVTVIFGNIAEAKGYSYRSAKTGRYTTGSYASSHKSTTYSHKLR